MLLVLSPAKSLDLTPAEGLPGTKPRFLKDTTELAAVARKLSVADLSGLMDISDRLAELNHQRFRTFKPRAADGVQAALAFAGDVYRGLDARSLDAEALAWAQDHVRILSGLYGLLRPLDLMRPYRLEMGTALKIGRKTGLYGFWGTRIGEALAEDLSGHRDKTLINLASKEYFDAVAVDALPGPVLAIDFRDERASGELRFNTFVAKKARGAMARFMVDERLETPAGLKAFDGFGYRYREEVSDDDRWAFVRKA